MINHDRGFKREPASADGHQKIRKRWSRPELGSAKLNVDGSFAPDGRSGAGMVLRDYREVVFAACRRIDFCTDATEAELAAIEEGISLALHWTPLKLIMETDCAEALELIRESTPNTSSYAFRISKIRDLIKEREIGLAKISRDANAVSHELAKIGRVQARTAFWLSDLPQEIAAAVSNGCTPTPV